MSDPPLGEDIEADQALSKVHRLQAKLGRKIKELTLSTDSHGNYKVGRSPYLSKLQVDLEKIKVLLDEYEASVDRFNDDFGLQRPQKAAEADRFFGETFDAYIRLKQNIVRPQQPPSPLVKQKPEESLSSSSEESQNKNVEEAKEEGEQKPVNYLKQVVIGVLITIVFYAFLGLVIYYTLKSRNGNGLGFTSGSNVLEDNDKTCGADSFMIRDTVCDDPSNNAKCLYDGGDCCREFKNKALCKTCACILEVDIGKLNESFNTLDIRPLQNATSVLDSGSSSRQIVRVENVVSGQVCAVLCLDHEKKTLINAWYYNKAKRVCHCHWMMSTHCPENLVKPEWTFSELDFEKDILMPISKVSTAFIQLRKTVPCSCSLDNFLINTEISEEAAEDSKGELIFAKTLWHCQQTCDRYQDCSWFSWQKEEQQGCFLMGQRQCKILMDFPAGESLATYTTIDDNWISSSKNCTWMSSYFATIHLNGENLKFVCPRRQRDSVATSFQMDKLGANEELIIYLNGWTESSVEVLNVVDDNTIYECAHNLLPPVHGLLGATGGVLELDNAGHALVVCGGEMQLDSSLKNHLCLALNRNNSQDTMSALNMARSGSASLVIDNGKTLWVTGGMDEYGIFPLTEYITPSQKTSDFATNNQHGPELPTEYGSLADYCLVSLGPDNALLIGGTHDLQLWRSQVWSISISSIWWWVSLSDLKKARSKLACGTLRVDGGGDRKVVIAAGGETSSISATNRVELLLVENGDITVLDQHWEDGPDMPEAISNGASATTSDQSMLFVFGGFVNNDVSQISSKVFRLKFHHGAILDCCWTKMEHELKMPSARGLALRMPPNPMVVKEYLNPEDCDIGKQNILLVTTGGNGFYETVDTEVFAVSEKNELLRCSMDMANKLTSPIPLKDATGQAISNTKPFALLCGGGTTATENQLCYPLGGQNSSTVEMSTARYGAASTVIGNDNGSRLWLTGGHTRDYDVSGDKIQSTEFLDVSQGRIRVSEGPPLPEPLFGHCLEMLSDDTAILFGGSTFGTSSMSLGQVWTMDGFSNPSLDLALDYQWIERHPLKFPRQGQGCGVIRTTIDERKLIVAAGGIWKTDALSNTETLSSSVEFLEVDNDRTERRLWHWQAGPVLPITLAYAGSAVSPDQNVLFLAVGITVGKPFMAWSFLVYKLQCADTGNCKWSIANQELQYTRASSVAILIPGSALDTAPSTPTSEGSECLEAWKGDDVCDGRNNIAECEFDGGDCCSGMDQFCDECVGFECKCHLTGYQKCGGAGTCHFGLDGICDGPNNNEFCDFDNGDCCLMDNPFCFNCEGDGCFCLATNVQYCFPVFEHCPEELNHNFIFDQRCDDELNIAACLYDGGDCCLENKDTTYCYECECLADIQDVLNQ